MEISNVNSSLVIIINAGLQWTKWSVALILKFKFAYIRLRGLFSTLSSKVYDGAVLRK